MSIKVAVIGTGWADRVQIPAFQAAGLDVVAVASRDPERARAVAQRHRLARHTDSWRELLTMPVDLISVTSPPAAHAEQALAVLEAGKHLLLEKPMALKLAEAETLLAASEQRPEQRALLDFELRFTPARRKARQLLRDNAIGRVITVTARVANGDRIDPTGRWSWWSDAAQGGGILNAIGSHVLDGIRWLLECDIDLHGATLGRVYPQRPAPEGTPDGPREVTADDIASLTFAAGDAVGTALIHGAALDDAIDLLTIRGEQGTLVIDRSLKLYYGKRGRPLKEYLTSLPPSVPNRFRASGFAAGTVLFGEALRAALSGDDPDALEPAAGFRDGAAVQALIDAARASAPPLLPHAEVPA